MKHQGHTKIVWMYGISRTVLGKNERTEPSVYQLLKGNATFEWSKECQHTFIKLKEYLSQAPLLVSPIEAKTLFMYLAVMEVVISALSCSLHNGKNCCLFTM